MNEMCAHVVKKRLTSGGISQTTVFGMTGSAPEFVMLMVSVMPSIRKTRGWGH